MLSIAVMKAEIQKKMATVTADVVTWQDTAVKTGSTYTYRIRASYVRSGKNTVYGAASPPLAAKAELGKARAVAEAVSGPCNRVSWKKVSGASGYHIYRKLQGKSWVRIGTVNNKVLSWKDTEIEGITSYAYAVRPYKKVDGKKSFRRISGKQLYPVLSGTPEDILCQEDLQGAEDLLESAEESRLLSDLP